MHRICHAVILATALCAFAFPPLIAQAEDTPHAYAQAGFTGRSGLSPTSTGSPVVSGHVYLGRCDSAGQWTEPTFEHLPLVGTLEGGSHTVNLEREGIDITAREGVKLRADHLPSAAEVGRLHAGAVVHLHAIHLSGGGSIFYAWGKVDLRAPLALDTPHPAHVLLNPSPGDTQSPTIALQSVESPPSSLTHVATASKHIRAPDPRRNL